MEGLLGMTIVLKRVELYSNERGKEHNFVSECPGCGQISMKTMEKRWNMMEHFAMSSVFTTIKTRLIQCFANHVLLLYNCKQHLHVIENQLVLGREM